ncbi:MAG TPA: hypothetical protein VNO30_04530 [Kofleriaceae bacterium]|nr:hypothetical protein [Kofleriaceae bacterium]
MDRHDQRVVEPAQRPARPPQVQPVDPGPAVAGVVRIAAAIEREELVDRPLVERQLGDGGQRAAQARSPIRP